MNQIIWPFFLILAACSNEASESMTSQKWTADLDTLSSQLLKRHIEPFKYVSQVEFEAAVQKLRSRIPELSDAAIQVEFGRLVAMLKDGHTELWLPREGIGFHYSPLQIDQFEDDYFVYATPPDLESWLGTRLLAINQMPISEVTRLVAPLIAGDNMMELCLSLQEYIVIPEVLEALNIVPEGTKMQWTLVGPDGEKTIEIVPLDWETLNETNWKIAGDHTDAPFYRQKRSKYYWYEYLSDYQAVYFKYNRCANQDGEKSVKRFTKDLFKFFDKQDAQWLIVDLRNNRGGNYNRSKQLEKEIRKRANLDGKLIVITGRETFSAATVTAIHLKVKSNALLVGEPSRSRPNGAENYEWFFLPHSNLRVDYTNRLKDHMPELGDSPTVPVDIAVVNTFESVSAGRDLVLERVLEEVAKKSAL